MLWIFQQQIRESRTSNSKPSNNLAIFYSNPPITKKSLYQQQIVQHLYNNCNIFIHHRNVPKIVTLIDWPLKKADQIHYVYGVGFLQWLPLMHIWHYQYIYITQGDKSFPVLELAAISGYIEKNLQLKKFQINCLLSKLSNIALVEGSNSIWNIFTPATLSELGNTFTHWSHEITAEKLYLILALWKTVLILA